MASDDQLEPLLAALESADRPLIVAGPADPAQLQTLEPADVLAVADHVGAPVFADLLSGLRVGSHLEQDGGSIVFGGYDGYVHEIPQPDVVLRFGASPTSKPLRQALRDADARQFLLDRAGGWREATFTATDLFAVPPGPVFDALADRLGRSPSATGDVSSSEWLAAVDRAERTHWSVCHRAREASALADRPFEGAVVATALESAPAPATVFVSNSMPIRDADRFVAPRDADLTVLANRGVSGIDGITSTALGAGSAVEETLVLVTGDLAFYHDANGLLAIDRCGVDATIVLLDNDGGGIFHKLPIESFDPPFTDQFKTPHGLEFEALGEYYDVEFDSVTPADFGAAYERSLESPGTQILRVAFDSESSHRRREELAEQVQTALEDGIDT